MGVIGLVVLATLSGGAAALLALRAYTSSQRQRTEALQHVAQRLGLTFQAEPTLSIVAEMRRFELFEQGRERKLKNFMVGMRGDLRCAVFDYSYVTGSGKSRSVWKQTVVSIHSKSLDLPSFSLRPEHMFHRIAQVFGYQDIDFDDRPDFSRRYLLRGADAAAVRAAFTPLVADFFERQTKCCAAGEGQLLFFWRTGRFARPEELQERITEAETLAHRLITPAERPRTL